MRKTIASVEAKATTLSNMLDQAIAGINELELYVTSNKFSQDQMVNTADILLRIRETRYAMLLAE